MHGWHQLLRLSGELIFPPACPACERTLSLDDGDWCGDCAAELLAVSTPDYCPRCGVPVGPHLVNPAGCGVCRDRLPKYDEIVRVGAYHGLVGELVKKFKFGRQHRLDRVLGRLLSSAISPRSWADQIDALVPVPTNWHGRWRYRCFPVGMIAARVGRELKLPVLPMLQVRGKKRRQTELSTTERPGNVRGVFHLDRSARISGASFCVIDDVSTSGATLQEVANVLKKGGAAHVYAAVLAKTEPGKSDA